MSLPTPNTRKEQYLNAIATGNAGGLPTPITREEEYLDAIAKSGGGSGEGDMKKSVYDSDLDVAGAGGIKAFVSDAVSGKVDKVEGKGLSTNDYDDTEKGKVTANTSAIEAIENEYGAKNLLPNNQGKTSTVQLPVTFTQNADGSVSFSVTGAFTGTALFLVANHMHFAADIKISGLPNIEGCSAYLYDNTASQQIWITENDQLIAVDATHDYGFVLTIASTVTSGTTGIYYPMFRDARITDPTYVPYAMTNRELTDNVVELTNVTPQQVSEPTISFQLGGVLKYGKLVIVQLRFTTTSSTPARGVLYTGLPKPYLFSNLTYDAVFLTSNNGKASIDAQGTLYYIDATPGNTIIITGAYIWSKTGY